jgi:ABC-2 type transport system permease protein
MIFGTLALLFSMLLPSRRMAAMLSSILLIASFFITALARLDNRLTKLANFSPMDYYQGGLAMDGMEWKWLLEMLAISALFVLAAWWQFERRDIRVGGEGNWRLPVFRRRKQVNAAPGD